MTHITFKDIIKTVKTRKYIVAIVILLLFLLYSGTYTAPRISVTAQVHGVTDMNYDNFVKYTDIPSELKTRDNCRFITVYVKFQKPFIFTRNVNIKQLTLNRYLEDIQYFNGQEEEFKYLGGYSSGGRQEFSEGIDVYSKDITDDKLKDFFKDYRIEVTWVSLLGRKNKEIFFLKDYFH